MKAAVLTNWEEIKLKDVNIPELNEGECLVKVKYAGVCGSDVHIFEGNHPTAETPVVLGHEFTGVVKKIKFKKQTDLEVGDRIVAEPLISCGHCEACKKGNWHVCKELKLLGIHKNGGFAEYVKVPLEKVIKISDKLSDRVAALTEPFAVGFHVNRRAGVKNGDNIFVVGGGPIGLIVGMVAKLSGANQVVFSEILPDRIKQIESFGFTAINPKKENIMSIINELTDDNGFEVVFEVSGSQSGILLTTDACKIRGKIVPVGFPGETPKLNILQTIFKELTMIGSRVYTFTDFEKTVKMLEKIIHDNLFDIEKLISDTYKLKNLENAIHVMKQGKNLGKILIKY